MADLLRVVCTDQSHAGRTAIVATFYRIGDRVGQVIREHGILSGWGLVQSERNRSLPPRVGGAAGPHDEGVDDRLRFRLECELCGLSLTVRGERLTPVFDRLAEAGQRSITLRGLAGIVS